MKKWLSFVLVLAGAASLVPSARAQAKPTATTSGGEIQAGVGYLYLNTDYAPQKDQGLSAWADYDFNRYIGVEGLAHYGGIISPSDIGENSY